MKVLIPHFFFLFLEVRDGWITSLLASRGQQSPAPSPLHGQITMKDTRGRAYAAVWSHDLWIYPNKDGFQLGIASFSIPLNVASIKSSGKHSFTLITPYKTFRYLIGRLSVSRCDCLHVRLLTLFYFHPIFVSPLFCLWPRPLPAVCLWIHLKIWPSGWTSCPRPFPVLCPAARWRYAFGKTLTIKCAVTVAQRILSGRQSTCYWSSVMLVQVQDSRLHCGLQKAG